MLAEFGFLLSVLFQCPMFTLGLNQFPTITTGVGAVWSVRHLSFDECSFCKDYNCSRYGNHLDKLVHDLRLQKQIITLTPMVV